MILATAARTGLSVVREAVRLATGAGAHAVWWLDHRLGGSARKATGDEPESR